MSRDKAPRRFMLAGTNSGCGKTTLTCAILQAFVNRGLKAASFKCGPDYIDPMFHSEVIGAHSRNLDLFFFDGNTASYLLCKNAIGSDISVLEGVMGFYDGVRNTESASSYDVARATRTPVVLVVSVRGMALSAAAIAKGFADFRGDSGIKAVVLNNCSEKLYEKLKPIVEKETKLHVAGYMPSLPSCRLESRHLGLVTAAEVENLREKLQTLARYAEETIELDYLLKLADGAKAPVFTKPALPSPMPGKPVRVAVARDKAFCFYYEDSLELISELGAELVPFSPMNDASLPPDIDGVILGGGYPELYAEKLSGNTALMAELCEKLRGGLPCIAECGGFLYLHKTLADENGKKHTMVGYIDAYAAKGEGLRHFGYVQLSANEDNMLCKEGSGFIPSHEFHYWRSSGDGGGFSVLKAGGTSAWGGVYASKSLYAGFPHLHFYSAPKAAKNFLLTCKKYRKAREEQ